MQNTIKAVKSYYINNKIQIENNLSGVYAFWWLGEKEELLNGNNKIIFKGPNSTDVIVEYKDWWPENLQYPCLYVGKSTNIKSRFSLHIKSGSKKRLHIIPDTKKVNPKTTSCQLRYGIEHVFNKSEDPLEIIFNKVGFSYTTDFPDNPVAERFYMEDKLIGLWRPWFNIDSER